MAAPTTSVLCADTLRLAQRERPAGPPAMLQRWDRLAFLHWELAADELQGSLPPELTLDCFEGRAFVGIVPFAMRKIRPRGFPALPGLSNFGEINVRTYVIGPDGVPGVWFYSLDASQRIACAIARRFFHLPYHAAKIDEVLEDDGYIYYETRRRRDSEAAGSFRYRPRGEIRYAEPGGLEFFLLERYALFARNPQGVLSRGMVHHDPYPIQDLELPMADDRLVEAAGLRARGCAPDLLHFSPGVDVEVFGLARI